MASSVANGHSGSNGLSAAQKVMEKHSHNAEVEDVPDEADSRHTVEPLSDSVLEAPEDQAPMSSKAVGKRKEDISSKIDPMSDEAFPALGGPKITSAPSKPIWNINGNGTNGNSSNGTLPPVSGLSTPVQQTSRQDSRKTMVIPGQVKEDYTLEKHYIIPRTELKKPLAAILNDINKKSKKVIVTQSPTGNSAITFTAVGPSIEAVRQALRDVVSQIGAKFTERVQIPQSARAHIIGKAGSKIKEIQERSGAQIKIPKMEDAPSATEEDDDPLIEILVEGNALAVGTAQRQILKIAGERAAAVNTKLRTVPAEFYPFIKHNKFNEAVDVRVPPSHTWSTRPPPQKAPSGKAEFLPVADDNPIILNGDRAAVLAVKAEIESLVAQLKAEVEVEQLDVPNGRHQFILERGSDSADDFFKETGCSIILPQGDDDVITIVGPWNQVKAAKKRATVLHSEMKNGNLDIRKNLRGVPDPSMHVRNLTQYLRQRKVIEELETAHKAHIVASTSQAGPWEIYSRDYENISDATAELRRIAQAHPPSRMTTVDVDSFYHPHLQKDILPKVKNEFGVHIVIPPSERDELPILLVYEGTESDLKVSRDEPSPQEIKEFQQRLQAAQKHILDIFAAQSQIVAESIDVPMIFHTKLQKYIKFEQDNLRAMDQIPIRVSSAGTMVTLRGPKPVVEALTEKVKEFVEQAVQDEKERGFTLSFDFPQNHANQLIGKGGSNINGMREKFDVDITVKDGKVELKGPMAKAEAAKTHISALGRQWADETTHALVIDPKYHRELIGAQGNQINRLQTKYKVQIHFPHSARRAKDEADAASEGGRKPRREQASNEVIVKGPKKGADEARGELLDLLQYLADNSNVATVSVQQSQVPSLIGQGGKLMDELRLTTGARIDIPNAKDSKDPSGNVDIQIKGTKSQVAQAKKLLEEKKTVFDNTITKILNVDKKHHRALIGAQGSKIREIVVQAGGSDNHRSLSRTVQFPKTESDGNTVRIEGDADLVARISAAIEGIIAERESQTTEIIDVPTEKHRSLIGRGGDIKKELESTFQVTLDIPRQGNGQTGVKIIGLPADVEKAKIHILDLVKGQEGETIQVPRSVHHRLSDRGQFFRKLKANHQVSITHDGAKLPPKPSAPAARVDDGDAPLITDDPEDSANAFYWAIESAADDSLDGDIPWVLRGPPENVAKAKAQIQAAVAEALKNKIGYLVLPDPQTYRYVVGQGGAKVNSIRKATGCAINVPRTQEVGEAIEVSGTAEGIEKAKEMILNAVKEGGNSRA